MPPGINRCEPKHLRAGIANELKNTGVTVACLMPGVTDTNFFERADMMDTKGGGGTQENKADPAEVAKTGFEAMMKGKSAVVATPINDSNAPARSTVENEWSRHRRTLRARRTNQLQSFARRELLIGHVIAEFHCTLWPASIRYVCVQLIEPYFRRAVRGRSPISPRRQVTAGDDLGSVG